MEGLGAKDKKKRDQAVQQFQIACEKRLLIDENDKNQLISSNLEKAVEKGLNLVQNISEVWGSSDYAMKQTLKYLIFPVGILYNKQNDTVRTNKTNLLFTSISYLPKTKKTTFCKIIFLEVMSG